MRDLTESVALPTINAPEDLDALTATTGGADRPIQDPLQNLLNQSAYIRDGLTGLLLPRPAVFCTGPTLVWTGAKKLWLGRQVYSSTGITQTLTSLFGGTLTANTWYYVYAYINTGVIALEISTTAPVLGLSKGTDATRRFLTCFRARTVTNAYPFNVLNGHYSYLRGYDSLGIDDYKVLNAGHSTAVSPYASVDVSAFVPPHALLYRVQLEFYGRNATDDSAGVKAHDQTGVTDRLYAHAGAVADGRYLPVEFSNDTNAQAFDYVVSNSGATLNGYVLGFDELS
jgi:hypothetical protein